MSPFVTVTTDVTDGQLANAAATPVPIWFDCERESLCALLHPGSHDSKIGVVIVVGGPQYKAGSHRQFVLLARGLAEQGIPTFRFDCRGMGDSSGEFPGFEALDLDIRAAITAFLSACPGVERVVLWGLCDGASAAAFYAYQDQRIHGLCLANPWVRTEQGEAAAIMKYYYLRRLLSVEFWRKLLSGGVQFTAALGSLLHNAKQTMSSTDGTKPDAQDADLERLSLPDRLFGSLRRFSHPVAFLISGQDLTASEFMAAASGASDRKRWMASSHVTVHTFAKADHTFSRRSWMDRLVEQTVDWVQTHEAVQAEDSGA